MKTKLPNLISADDAEAYQAWALPEVGGAHNVPASVRKAKALIERRREEAKARQAPVATTLPEPVSGQATAEAINGEVIEDVAECDGIELSPITAEQLQEITEAAAEEGYAEGHERGLQQGQAEGYQKGFERGEAEARQQVTATLTAQAGQLLQVAEALVNPIGEQEQQLSQLLLNYVTTLTRQIVGRELLLDSSHILSVVEQALQALPVGSDRIQIYLNPDDLAVVEAYAEARDKPWGFHGAEELLPGGCRIESAHSLVDFSVESRLEAMFEQFLAKQLAVANTDELQAGEPVPNLTTGTTLTTGATADLVTDQTEESA